MKWATTAQKLTLVSLMAILPLTVRPQELTTAPEYAIGTHLKLKGIVNFGQVTKDLYRGGLPSPSGLTELHKKGIAIVVDMRGRNRAEQRLATELGMDYVAIPSHCPFPTDHSYAEFLKVVEQNPGKKIFVHCRLGDDRTGMAVAAYRMAEEGWSADAAMKEMQAFGFTPIHRMICPRMAEYERSFPERLKKETAFRGLLATRNAAH